MIIDMTGPKIVQGSGGTRAADPTWRERLWKQV
jgi:hypothetical protein